MLKLRLWQPNILSTCLIIRVVFWWKMKRAVYKVASLYFFQKELIAAINCYELCYSKLYARCWNILSKIGLHKDYRPLRVSNHWIFTVCREIVWFIMYICVQQWLSLCDGFMFLRPCVPLILPPQAGVVASRLTAVFMNLACLIAD